jgi:DNA-directed RNA polymerase specialized sigma24 family protein
MADDPDDFFIRNFARERDRGDLARALEIWEDLALRSYPRIENQNRAFRFPGGRPLATPQDRDDAAQEAYLRVMALGARFRGTTGAEFRAALTKTVWNACMDFGRRLLAYEKGIGGSLDERYDGDDEGSPYDGALARWLDEREAAARDAEEDESQLAAQADLVRWAIAHIENGNYRKVLEMTFGGVPAEDIAATLKIGIDNLYARRSRGMRALEKTLRELDS